MGNAQKILDRIKNQDIKPKPLWQVWLKRFAIWAIIVFAICFGAISFSVILYVIQEADFDLLSQFDDSRIELILALMPFIWVLFLILFLFLSVAGLRYAPKGYKHSLRKIFGVTTLISVVLGAFICVMGGGQYFDQTFEDRIGNYRGVEQRKIEMWSRPADGRLSGTITSVSLSSFVLTDHNNIEWTIEYPDAFVAGRVQLTEGEMVKLIGNVKDANTFTAAEIRPWGRGDGKGKGRMRQRNK
jgi:hypothetical protein